MNNLIDNKKFLLTSEDGYILSLPKTDSDINQADNGFECVKRKYDNIWRIKDLNNELIDYFKQHMSSLPPTFQKFLDALIKLDTTIEREIYLPLMFEEKISILNEDISLRYDDYLLKTQNVKRYTKELQKFFKHEALTDNIFQKLKQELDKPELQAFIVSHPWFKNNKLDKTDALLQTLNILEYEKSESLDFWREQLSYDPEYFFNLPSHTAEHKTSQSIGEILKIPALALFDKAYVVIDYSPEDKSVCFMGLDEDSEEKYLTTKIEESLGVFFSFMLAESAMLESYDDRDLANEGLISIYQNGMLKEILNPTNEPDITALNVIIERESINLLLGSTDTMNKAQKQTNRKFKV